MKHMSCPICSRAGQDEGGLCSDHLIALRRIVKAFEIWNKAYGGISRSEYLREILNRPETGKLAIEAAQFLLRENGNMNLWKIIAGD